MLVACLTRPTTPASSCGLLDALTVRCSPLAVAQGHAIKRQVSAQSRPSRSEFGSPNPDVAPAREWAPTLVAV